MGGLEYRLLPVKGRLREAAGNARRQWPERRGWLLELRDDEGRRGWGEASPLPGFSPDSFESAGRALELFRRSPSKVPLGGEDLESEIEGALAPIGRDQPAARCAAETALLDLLGQRQGQPVHALLGRPRARSRELAALLPMEGGAACVAAAAELWRSGFRTFKLKVGGRGAFETELATLRALRERLGTAARLRLDANGAWEPAEAAERLRALAVHGPELLEEPVRGSAWREIESSPLPLALDESLLELGAEDLEALAGRGILSALVLKPMLLGGAWACLRLARWAEQRGLAVLVTHLFDGPVALAAAAHLSLALPGRVLAAGLAPHAGLAAWPRAESPWLGPVEIRPPGKPGLALEGFEVGR